jgi:DNA-binding IclR family transcriptional regulator
MLGNLYTKDLYILKAGTPGVKAINELTREAVSLGVLYGSSLVYVIREESNSSFRLVINIGSYMPAYASCSGRALLSELNESELDALYPEENLAPVAKNSIPNKTELKLELELIRKTGVAIDRESCFDEIDAVASVIRNTTGKAVAAIAIAVPSARMTGAKRDRFAELVKMGANLISYQLGYQSGLDSVCSIDEIRSWYKRNSFVSSGR